MADTNLILFKILIFPRFGHSIRRRSIKIWDVKFYQEKKNKIRVTKKR